MTIPSIGGTRGIFEIFIPGAFLLLNFAAFLYCFPSVAGDIQSRMTDFASNQILSVVVLIAFGYLTGVLLRLLKTRWPDRLSAVCCWLWYGKGRERTKEYYFEPFPYFKYLSRLSKHKLPPEASEFCQQVWQPRKTKGGNREYFNYWKAMINSLDERSATDIYSAEALSRYVSGMFYALAISLGLVLVNTVLHRFPVAMIVVAVAYFFGILVIILNFRFLRVKEVELVFAASLRNFRKYKKAMFSDEDPDIDPNDVPA